MLTEVDGFPWQLTTPAARRMAAKATSTEVSFSTTWGALQGIAHLAAAVTCHFGHQQVDSSAVWAGRRLWVEAHLDLVEPFGKHHNRIAGTARAHPCQHPLVTVALETSVTGFL